MRGRGLPLKQWRWLQENSSVSAHCRSKAHWNRGTSTYAAALARAQPTPSSRPLYVKSERGVLSQTSQRFMSNV